MPHVVFSSLASGLAAATAWFAAPVPVQTAEPASLAWHIVPSAHYATDVQMTHVNSFDMNGMLRKLMGSRADTTTIIEQRAIALAAGEKGKVDISTVDIRRYGGDHPKDPSSVRRTSAYAGSIAANGSLTPSNEPLTDAGDGGLAELPSSPIAVGQSWTFARKILVEREIGQGSMNYTDTLTRVDTRAGHRIAVIAVKGAGRVDVFQDLQAKGFHTADMTLSGTAEFDLTSGLPGVQHYTAHIEWTSRPMGVHIGVVFDDTYDAAAWTSKDH